ncbi:hypothetical protein DFH07DRAFT_781093 [Mycena maculata]|uniref:Zn(2)-C6 fungal-type domain-containing protein n=1 Tax=Mycena maculata TaxID=230809 RepID=A0AAD7MT17_9AGAR|nr:hypothetical protein DFH07DRAFT_781093 [Mycena maculata]
MTDPIMTDPGKIPSVPLPPMWMPRRRVITACTYCRKRKIRCLTWEEPPKNPCERCTKKGLKCEYITIADQRDEVSTKTNMTLNVPPPESSAEGTPHMDNSHDLPCLKIHTPVTCTQPSRTPRRMHSIGIHPYYKESIHAYYQPSTRSHGQVSTTFWETRQSPSYGESGCPPSMSEYYYDANSSNLWYGGPRFLH